MMTSAVNLPEDIFYIGVNDRDIDLFEGQYAVPDGVSYNSYLIMDEKIAVMDTVDQRKKEEYLENLEKALGEKSPDYLIVSHVEPDHASSIGVFLERYPHTKLVGNAKTFQMLANYFNLDHVDAVTVKDGDILSLGKHELHFLMTPMVHWPEVMFTYDSCGGVLFSADAFGRFGVPDGEEDWDREARRYYFNIVGKFGMPVQNVMKKAAGLDIQVICPLHGPILKENLGYYLDKYKIWSSYEPETEGVFIAYASFHGNTAQAARKLEEILRRKGCRVESADLARDDMAAAVGNAFRYSKLVLAAVSYNGGLMPYMETYLHLLKGKNFQKRQVALIENGTWGPSAKRCMSEILSQMSGITVLEPQVTIQGAVKESTVAELEALADGLLA